MKNSIFIKKTAIILAFLLALTVFWSRIFFGIDFTDSFFHLNASSMELHEMYPTFFLSSVFIKWFSTALGTDLLIYRIINASLLFISILIPFLSRIKNLKLEDLLWISCGLIILTPLNANILGYDTFSVFILSLIYFFNIHFFKKSDWWSFAALILLVSIAIPLRLPNLGVLIIVSILVWYIKNFWTAIIFFGIVILLILAIYLLGYGKVENILTAFYGGNAHRPLDIILKYVADSFNVVLNLIFLFSITLLYRIRFLKKRVLQVIVVSLVLTFLILFIFHSKYSKDYSIFILSLLVWSIVISMINRKQLDSLQQFAIILFPFIVFVIPFGSNTGLLKAALMTVLLPYFIRVSQLNKNKIFVLIMIAIVPISLLEAASQTYEDGSIRKTSCIPDIEKLESIRTTELRKNYIEQVVEKSQMLRSQSFNVYYYGDKSHIFKYLQNSEQQDFSFYQGLNEDYFLDKIEGKNKSGKNAVFVVDAYPDIHKIKEERRISYFEKKLLEMGYKRFSEGRFKLYICLAPGKG